MVTVFDSAVDTGAAAPLVLPSALEQVREQQLHQPAA